MAKPRARADLPGDHPRARAPARPADDGARLGEQTPLGTAFTVSIEAREGVTTGISAADRAHTIRAAMARDARPSDLARPGHVFPLRASPAACCAAPARPRAPSTSRASPGLEPAGVICEIMNDDGTMARMPDLRAFARAARPAHPDRRRPDPVPPAQREPRGARRRGRRCRRAFGDFRAIVFKNEIDHVDHVALRARRDPRRRADAGARAQRVPDRRRVRLAALRLRRAARRRR